MSAKRNTTLRPAMTFRQIADALGIEEGTAQDLFWTGIRKLRKRPESIRKIAELQTMLEQARGQRGFHVHDIS